LEGIEDKEEEEEEEEEKKAFQFCLWFRVARATFLLSFLNSPFSVSSSSFSFCIVFYFLS